MLQGLYQLRQLRRAHQLTKIGVNTVEANDQGAFDRATNLFAAPVAGTYFYGASLLYKAGASASARMRRRLVLNATRESVNPSLKYRAPTGHSLQRYGCRPWCR